jgi:hypothetical protein
MQEWREHVDSNDSGISCLGDINLQQSPQHPSPHHRSPQHPSPHHRSPQHPSPHHPSPQHPSPHHRSPHQPSPHLQSPHHPSPRLHSPFHPSPHQSSLPFHSSNLHPPLQEPTLIQPPVIHSLLLQTIDEDHDLFRTFPTGSGTIVAPIICYRFFVFSQKAKISESFENDKIYLFL